MDKIDILVWKNKTYLIGYDNIDKRPCEKCILRSECLEDESDMFLSICEPWMSKGSCYVKEEINEK